MLAYFTGDEFFPGGYGSFVAQKDQYLHFENGPSETVELQWATFDDAADDNRALITRFKNTDVNTGPIGTYRHRAWGITKQGEDRKRRAAHPRTRVGDIEHPYVRSPDTRRVEVAILPCGVLPTVCRGDERLATREHDVARLVADEQRSNHARRR